jgi:hypothetical protein
MTTAIIDVASSFYVRGVSGVYLTARSTAQLSGADYLLVGQVLAGTAYYVQRGVLKFYTASIPDNAIISNVKLKLAIAADESATDFDVEIGEYDWSANDPVTGTNKEAVFDGILATGYNKLWKNSVVSLDTYYESEDDLDVDWINKTGFTYYSLISKEDFDASVPINFENLSFDIATKIPQLVVEYTIPVSTITGIASITGIQSITF